MKVTAEIRKEAYKKFGGSEKNTGSAEAQVAILTYEINHITEHLKKAKKDNNSTRALVMKVGQRKSFLSYLQSRNIERYRAILQELNLRK